MEESRCNKLLETVTPLLERLAGEWIPPGKVSPEGYHYACTFGTK